MTLESLLTESVTVFGVADGVADDYGNVSQTWAEVATENGRFEQRAAQERSDDQEVVVSDWVVYLLPDTAVTSRARVGDAYGRMFEVVGAPALVKAPRRDVYVEASLRFVESF